jgi:phage terminase large subunit-like protein
MDDEATAVTRSRTRDNAQHLAATFLAEMQRRYGNSALGRQELEGEIVEERMTGLWRRSHIEQGRLAARPELVRIVVAVDPPVSATTGSDSCGIIVAGLQVFKSIDANLPVKKVHASRGKYLRAEPVAALYAEGRVAHVGEFPELERQMCDFAADGLAHGKSPDRLVGCHPGISRHRRCHPGISRSEISGTQG